MTDIAPTQAAIDPAVTTPAAVPTSPARDVMQSMIRLQSPDETVFNEAVRELQAILVDEPANGMVLMGLGIGHARVQNWTEAQKYLEQAVTHAPKLASAHVNLGNLHRQQRRLKEAQAAYEKAIELQPGQPDAHYNLSVLLEEAGKLAQAEAAVRRALLFKPDYAEAHNNLGHLLIKAGKVEQALSHFRQALVWAPAMVQAQFNLILALYRLGRSHEAKAEVDRFLLQHPDNVQVLRVQAAGLMQMGQLDDAETVNRKLLSLEPDAPDLRLNQAETLLIREDYEGARAIYQELLSKRIVPPAIGIGALGNLMRAQGQFSEAKNLYQQALMMDNRMPALVLGHARTLLEAGDLRQGVASMQRAAEMLPNSAEVHAQLVSAMWLDPDIKPQDMDNELRRWTQVLATLSSAEAAQPVRPVAQARQGDEELRLGFLLGTATDMLAVDSLSALLKLGRKDIRLFFYQTVAGDVSFAPLQHHAQQWRPVAALGSTDLAEQIRQDAIDVLIDTIGHGTGSRLSVMAQHAAPVQLGWLGDFAPVGAPGIDTYLADELILPDETALQAPGASAPQVVRMSPLFHWQAPHHAPEPSIELPTSIVLGVLSPLSHINTHVLDAWAKVLEALPEAQLLVTSRIAAEDEATRQRLARLMMIREIDPGRVKFAPILANEDRFSTIHQMTVVLDTFPTTMGITRALECLWMGVPVLTLRGTSPWSRLTASVLAHAGLDAWIADTTTDWVAKAIQLPQERTALHNLRANTREVLRQAPVLNAELFTAAFETSIDKLWAQAIDRHNPSL